MIASNSRVVKRRTCNTHAIEGHAPLGQSCPNVPDVTASVISDLQRCGCSADTHSINTAAALDSGRLHATACAYKALACLPLMDAAVPAAGMISGSATLSHRRTWQCHATACVLYCAVQDCTVPYCTSLLCTIILFDSLAPLQASYLFIACVEGND